MLGEGAGGAKVASGAAGMGSTGDPALRAKRKRPAHRLQSNAAKSA